MARINEAVRQWLDRSRAHWDEGNLEPALQCCREALALDPSNVDALANAGTLCWIKGDVDEAERLYLAAHAIDPSHLGAILNIAALCHDAAELEESRAWIEKAEALGPGDPEVVWRKALLELATGDYANGWVHYEAALGRESIRGKGPGFETAPWTGARCGRLLIWHEQGFGDTLQFVRYAKLCKERAEKVLVLCPRELVAVVASCPFVDGAADAIDAGDFDQHISIMSLPWLFGTTLATVPAPIPYLFADDASSAMWAGRIRSDKLKVGLVWAGKFRRSHLKFHTIDRSRSVSLASLQPLLDVEGVEWYSLQKGETAGEANGRNITDFMAEIDDFAGTAAILSNLDLVISVDTSVVHLAGAMGKPVWVLSRADACWRWLRNRPDSPWYPSARVFGQPARGDWAGAIQAVRRELERAAS